MKTATKMIILIGFFSSMLVAAKERSDAFHLRAYDHHYKIVSPEKDVKVTSIILENLTMGDILGKVVDEKNNTIGNLAVKSQSFKSLNLNFEKNRKYFFIPLVPAFQSIELELGRRSYEIPGKH
jgi:hypothetical protein